MQIKIVAVAVVENRLTEQTQKTSYSNKNNYSNNRNNFHLYIGIGVQMVDPEKRDVSQTKATVVLADVFTHLYPWNFQL